MEKWDRRWLDEEADGGGGRIASCEEEEEEEEGVIESGFGSGSRWSLRQFGLVEEINNLIEVIALQIIARSMKSQIP